LIASLVVAAIFFYFYHGIGIAERWTNRIRHIAFTPKTIAPFGGKGFCQRNRRECLTFKYTTESPAPSPPVVAIAPDREDLLQEVV
jgi:hypothetical protein